MLPVALVALSVLGAGAWFALEETKSKNEDNSST